MKPDFREAAREYVIQTATSNKPDEYELKLPIGIMKEHCREDFTNGANHGYSLAIEQHRDFYLLVRELFQLYDSRYSETKGDPFTAAEKAEKVKVRIIMLEKEIEKRIASFTERELESLPFKD